MPYSIQKNEKISDIMNKFDMPYSLIQRYNPFVKSKDDVYEGRRLVFPRVHAVLPGESYEDISKTYSVLPLYLKELNPYMGDHSVIYQGQSIYLPPEKP